MFVFTVDRHVAAAPEVVFARVADLRRLLEVIPAIVRMEILADGPVRVGTRFRETRVVLGSKAVEEMTVSTFEPPKRIAMVVENYGCRYQTEFSCAPDGQGTRLTMVFTFTSVTMMGYVMSALLRPIIKYIVKSGAKDLDHINDAIVRDRHAEISASA